MQRVMGVFVMKYLVICLLLLNSAHIAAESSDCNIEFHISDEDDDGTNIRNRPSGEVILVMPKAKETQHTVHASQLKGGWWRVERIHHEAGAEILVNNAWIHQSVLGTGVDDGEVITDENNNIRLITPIYSKPTYRSKSGQYMKLRGETEILGCTGMWLKVMHIHEGKSIIGWWAPEDQCSSTVTNCHNGSSGEETGTDIWGNK